MNWVAVNHRLNHRSNFYHVPQFFLAFLLFLSVFLAAVFFFWSWVSSSSSSSESLSLSSSVSSSFSSPLSSSSDSSSSSALAFCCARLFYSFWARSSFGMFAVQTSSVEWVFSLVALSSFSCSSYYLPTATAFNDYLVSSSYFSFSFYSGVVISSAFIAFSTTGLSSFGNFLFLASAIASALVTSAVFSLSPPVSITFFLYSRASLTFVFASSISACFLSSIAYFFSASFYNALAWLISPSLASTETSPLNLSASSSSLWADFMYSGTCSSSSSSSFFFLISSSASFYSRSSFFVLSSSSSFWISTFFFSMASFSDAVGGSGTTSFTGSLLTSSSFPSSLAFWWSRTFLASYVSSISF